MAKTYEQIQRQIADLQAEAEQLRQQEVAEVVSRIREAITHYGLTAADLGLKVGGAARSAPSEFPARKTRGGPAAPRGKAAATVKFRDEAGRTWGGMGKRPTWLREALAAGRKLEDFKVPPG